MKKQNLLEISPVDYSASATKALHFKIPPNTKLFRLHWHDRMELLRVRQGKMYVEIGIELYTLGEGELIIIPPKALHKGYTLEGTVEYDVIMFDVRSFYNDTEVCKYYLPAIFEGRAEFKPVTTNTAIISCVDEIFEGSNRGLLETTGKIYELLGLFIKYELLEIQSLPKDNFAKEVIDFFEENISAEITESVLSQKFGYTSAHLCRKFKKATGLSPMTYLKILRLESAYRRIKNHGISPGSAAAEFGFSDSNYFTRCFRAHFGFPPSKSRDKKHS